MKSINFNWIKFLLIIILGLFTANFFVSFASAPKILIAFLLLLFAVIVIKPVYLLIAYSLFFWIPYFFGQNLLPEFMYGLSPAEATIYLFFLAYVIMGIQKRKEAASESVKIPFLIPLLVLFISGLIAYISSGVGSRELAVKIFRQISVYAPAVYVISTKMVKNPHDARKIMLGIVIGGVVYGGFAYFMAYEYIGQMISTVGRLGGEYILGNIVFFFNANSIGTHLSAILPVSIILWINNEGIVLKGFGIATTVLILFFLVLTGTRTAWLASAFSIIILILLSWKYNKLKLSRIMFILMLFAGVLAVIFIYELLSKDILERFESFRDRTAVESLDLRVILWKGGLRYLWESPFGIGYSDRYPYCAMTSPHNFYILIGIGSGVFGLIGFLWFIAGCIMMVLRKLRDHFVSDSEKPVLIAVISSVSAFLFNCMADVPTDANSISLIIIFMLLGLAVALTKENSPAHEN